MGWIFLTVIIFLLAVPAIVVPRLRQARATGAGDQVLNGPITGTGSPWIARILMIAGIFLLVVWLLVTAIRTVHVVQNGHIGIVKQFGAIVGTTSEGLVVTGPWQTLDPISVKTEKIVYNMTGDAGGDSLGSAVSKDSQPINLTVAVNYQVQRGGVVDLYRLTGGDFVSRIIDPAVPQEVKSITAEYKAIEFAQNRENVRTKAEAALDEVLSKQGIKVLNISFVNVGFSPEFDQAIEETQVAEQNAKREEARVRVSEAQADQAIAIANGDAKAQKIRADAEAYANRTVGASLTPEVLKIRAIEKLNDKVKVILLPSGNQLILPGDIVGTTED